MNKLLNEITKKEKELNSLYTELNSYIKTKTILNPNVKTFINYLLIYIEEPSCKRILKQFIDNYWFSLNINRKYPNVPEYLAFSINNSGNLVRINNKIVNFNSIDFEKTGIFTDNKDNIITPVPRKVYELKITKNDKDLITDIDFSIY